MNQLTTYQQWQQDKYGDILPEQGSTGGYQGTAWWENQVTLNELAEPITGTQTIHP